MKRPEAVKRAEAVRPFSSFALFVWFGSFGDGRWCAVRAGYGPLWMGSVWSARRVARTLMRDNVMCPVSVVGVDSVPLSVADLDRALASIVQRLPAPDGRLDWYEAGVFDGRMESVS